MLATRSRFAPSVHQDGPPPDGRPREQACTSWVTGNAPSQELPGLVGRIPNPDMGLVDKTLDELAQLTAYQKENQLEVAELGGPSLLLQLIRSRVKYSVAPVGAGASATGAAAPPEGDLDVAAVAKALLVLLNVSANDELAARVAAVPGGVALLTELLSHPQREVAVLAARCLINLTHSSSEGQAVALQASVLQPAIRLFMFKEVDHARCKLGCWLLANLTSGLDTAPHQAVLTQKPVVQRAVALVQDHVHAPESVVVLACRLLGNLAHAGCEAQQSLATSGALHALASLVEMPTLCNEVYAAALTALSALVLDHEHNTAALAARKELPVALGNLLAARSEPFKSTNEDACVVLAAHTFLHVVGHMLCNGGQGLPFSPAKQPAVNPRGTVVKTPSRPSMQSQPPAEPLARLEGADGNLVDGKARVVVAPPPLPRGRSAGGGEDRSRPGTAGAQQQQVVYIGLSSAAQAMQVCLPAGGPITGKHGEPALTPLEVAEIRHRVSHVLLPRLRSPNHRTAITAVACLYHLVAACGGSTAQEARALVTDAALALQLQALLSSNDAALVHATLAVLDVLCSEPACAKVAMSVGWVPTVVPLLDSPDALVRRWSERVLCSAYMAT